MISRRVFRKWPNYLLGASSELLAPALLAWARLRCGRSDPSPSAWRRGLILGHTKIGDVLYRTGSLEALALGLPRCEWHYLAAPDSAEVLEGNPNLKSVLPLCVPGESLRLAEGALGRLRRMGFDVALCTNPESYWLDLRIAMGAGIPNRVGFVHRGLSGLVTHRVPWSGPKPWAAYFRDMVAEIMGRSPDWPIAPRIYPGAQDREAAERAWGRLALGGRPVLACFMSTRQSSRVWPPDCYVAMLRQILRSAEIDVVIGGAVSEREALHRIARDLGGTVRVLAGELNLRAMCCFLERCAAVFASDSGPRHIANASGVPVVYIRNLYCSKIETGNYCPNEVDISPDVECVEVAEQEAWLRRVTPESVGRVVLATLGF